MSATADSIYASIRYTFFTAEPKFRTWSANEQRELFGAPIFGKKRIRWNAARRTVETYVTTISRDYDIQSYTLDEVAALVNAGKFASKGYQSYGNKSYTRVCK